MSIMICLHWCRVDPLSSGLCCCARLLWCLQLFIMITKKCAISCNILGTIAGNDLGSLDSDNCMCDWRKVGRKFVCFLFLTSTVERS